MSDHVVESREALVVRLHELAERVRSGQLHVENSSAADFIDGAAAWLADMDGAFANRGETPPTTPDWNLISIIFATALVYE